jgi:predicted phage tail protein
MRQVRLAGHLGNAFGGLHHFDISTPAEAIRALCANHRGFKQYVLKHNAPGYRVLVGKSERGEDELHVGTSSGTITIVPVVAGAGGGFGKVLLGAALIGASILLPAISPIGNTILFGTTTVGSLLGSVGISLVLGGVAGMLFKPPKAKSSSAERPDNLPSFAFDRAINTTGQGNAIALCYGEFLCGSQVISNGLSVDDIPA